MNFSVEALQEMKNAALDETVSDLEKLQQMMWEAHERLKREREREKGGACALLKKSCTVMDR